MRSLTRLLACGAVYSWIVVAAFMVLSEHFNAEAASSSGTTPMVDQDGRELVQTILQSKPGDTIRWRFSPTSEIFVLEVKAIERTKKASDRFFVDENEDGKPDPNER